MVRLYSLKHPLEWYAGSRCLKAADISDFQKDLTFPDSSIMIINVNYL